MKIPFTQYLRPHGVPRVQIFESKDLDQEIEDKANELIKAGFRFESEILTTGEVSMECLKFDQCLSGELCENGPPVIQAVKRLVEHAHKEWKRDTGEKEN